MPVRVVEIEAAAATPVIDLRVGTRARAAAVGNSLCLDAIEDRVELGVADLEGVMMRLELAALVEVEGQLLVDPHRREMRVTPVVIETEKPRKERGGRNLAARRHDRVIEMDCHGSSPCSIERTGVRQIRAVSDQVDT